MMTFKELDKLNTDQQEKKTPDYIKKAVAKYQSKFDRININLPRGLGDQVRAATGESVSGCVIRLLMEELEKKGAPYVPPNDDK